MGRYQRSGEKKDEEGESLRATPQFLVRISPVII
jgi:hypothetical protein